METARSIRGFPASNSFDDIDTYTSLQKQYAMLKLIITWNNKAQDALLQHFHLDKLIDMKVRGDELAVCVTFGKGEGGEICRHHQGNGQ